jgi:hypothetical protein
MSTPSSSGDAASSGHPKGPFAQLLSAILDPIEPVLKHIAALWGLFLLFGGLIFLFYFGSIGFLPDMDLKTSIILLAVAALTAASLLFVLTVYLLLAGWGLRSMSAGQKSKLLWFGLPALGLIVVFAVASVITMRWTRICLILLLFVPPLFFAFFHTREPQPSRSEKATVGGKAGAFFSSYAGLCMSEFAFSIALLLLAALLAAEPHANGVGKVLSAFVPAAFLVLSCNVALISLPARHVPGLAAVILFVVLSYTGYWSRIPDRVMRIYKFGDVRNATLVLDETGCAILAQHGLTASKTNTENPTVPKTCPLPNVTIKSRLGTTYYVEIDRSEKGSSPKGKPLLFTIPATDVLSWACESDENGKVCQ